jgi:hypothetical protein
MFKTYVWRIVLALAFLFGQMISITPVHAQEGGTIDKVWCLTKGNCSVIGTDAILALKKESQNWGLYVSNGAKNFKYDETWIRNENEAGWHSFGNETVVPDQIMIDPSLDLNIRLMGIVVQNGILSYHVPGWLLEGEVPTALPNSTMSWEKINLSTVTDIDFKGEGVDLNRSYYFDGLNIYAWLWAIDQRDSYILIHVLDVNIGFLTPVKALPRNNDYHYDKVANFNWVPGEKLHVENVYKDSRSILPTYEITLEDISWFYDDYIQALADRGMDEENAWEKVMKQHAHEIEEMTGVFPNYKNTNWRATIEWIDGYQFRRNGVELINIEDNNVISSRACTKAEHCYSTGYTPAAGDNVYVDPYTLEDIWGWKKFEKGNHIDMANLWVINVDPGREITTSDKALLQSRIDAGEVKKVFAIIEEPADINWDGDLEVVYNTGVLRDGETNPDSATLPISVRHVPPVNTVAYVWIYTDKASTKYDAHPEGEVMAIFDSRGKLWYFNNHVEKGHSFDAETYGLDKCGGMMTMDNWIDGCVP